jgi:hypothetical protein
MGLFSDLVGTLKGNFQIEKGGVKLKNAAGALEVKAADGTTDAPITTSKVNVSGNAIDLNSAAVGSGADWKYSLKRPANGMTAAVDLTLPATDGTPGQVMQTDGAGNLSFATAGTTEDKVGVNETVLSYDTTSPLSLFTLPINAIVDKIRVVIDTAFNGTAPTLSIGISGTASKFMASTLNDLKGSVGDVYECHPGVAAEGGTQALIATYAADGSTAGSARIQVFYTIPT